MEIFREFIATLFFIFGCILIFSLFSGLNWASLFGAVTCFVIANFFWPSKKGGHRKQDNPFLDIVEFVIEFPVEMFMWLLRLVGRLFRNKDGGFDLDVDL